MWMAWDCIIEILTQWNSYRYILQKNVYRFEKNRKFVVLVNMDKESQLLLRRKWCKSFQYTTPNSIKSLIAKLIKKPKKILTFFNLSMSKSAFFAHFSQKSGSLRAISDPSFSSDTKLACKVNDHNAIVNSHISNHPYLGKGRAFLSGCNLDCLCSSEKNLIDIFFTEFIRVVILIHYCTISP